MNLNARLKRLARRANLGGTPGPEVIFYLPDGGRGEPGPGRYPCSGSRATLVIYDPETGPPSDVAAGLGQGRIWA
jgi:hypothetical protein